MIPEIHREAVAALAEVWALSPDVRLGQLLAHLGFLGEAHLGRGLGYLEDDELLAVNSAQAFSSSPPPSRGFAGKAA